MNKTKTFTGSATLTDKTIIALIAVVKSQNIYLTVTVLDKGFYVSSKQYTKTLDITETSISDLFKNEVEANSKGLSYNLTYNF